MGKHINQVNPMVEANIEQGYADDDNADEQTGGFHNPLFSSTVGMPKDRSLFPSMRSPAEKEKSSKSSSMVMRRHKDGRKEGTMVDATRQRLKKTTSERQIRRVSAQDVPACVVVKKGDASDAGEILQHCAFHMEAFKVQNKSTGGPSCTTFLFVFHGGKPNQVALEITHKPRPTSAGSERGAPASQQGDDADATILARLPPSPTNGEGRVTMTLGGKVVPHLPGEPYSCNVHQVGTVTFNPRKQAKGSCLYILSQEGRTLFTALG